KSLKPLWNFLSGCLVLSLILSGTVSSVIVNCAGLEGISVGSGGSKNQNPWLPRLLSSMAWKEELGLVPMPRIKEGSSHCTHRCEMRWSWYLFAALGWIGWTGMWNGTRKKQGKRHWTTREVDWIRSWGETFSRALPLEGQHDKNFFDYCCNRREVQTSTHVFKIYGNGIDRKGCLLVLTLVLLLYFEIFQAINPIGSTFRTQALKSGRSVVLQLSPPSIVVRSHLDRADNNKPWQCVHCLQYISEENLDKKVLCSLLWKRHHEQTPGNDSKNTMELLDFHRIPRLDHLLDLCHYQPHYPDTSREQINTFSIFSSDHASEHLIVCSERSIDWHHSCYRQHRSAQPWFISSAWKDHDCILQTSKRVRDRNRLNKTNHYRNFHPF
ncbi:hypothetical protein PSTT_01061, partial [Puccinia striiformis]